MKPIACGLYRPSYKHKRTGERMRARKFYGWFKHPSTGRTVRVPLHHEREQAEQALRRLLTSLGADAMVRKELMVHYPSGYLYLIGGGGLHKIGTTVCVADRLQGLQSASPVPLTLVAASAKVDHVRRREWELHRKYAARRRHGEWFDLTAEQVEQVRDYLQAGLNNPPQAAGDYNPETAGELIP